MRLEAVGEFSLAGPEGDPMPPISNEMIGVFSSSTTLLPVDAFNPRLRVVDAIEAGVDVLAHSDISQDFFIDNILIETPVGATHLFVAPLVGFVGDNRDNNRNFAIRISSAAIPEPASSTLLTIACGAMFVRRRRLIHVQPGYPHV